MAILPLRTLQINLNEPVDRSYIDDGEYAGYEYRWRATLDVTPQLHFSTQTRVPYQYDGNDIVVGDWFATTDDGVACVITEIVSQTDVAVDCWFQDIDHFNLMNDGTLSGIARPLNGTGYLFPLGDNGLPEIAKLPSFAMGINFQANLTARFIDRNPIAGNIPIYQVAHGLAQGDIVYLTYIDEEGTYIPQYVKIIANDANKDNLEKVIGEVADVSDVNNFTLNPYGQYRVNISPTLPGTYPGDLLYVSPDVAGALTDVKPDKNVKPIVVRINDTTGVYLSGAGGSGSAGPLGYYATVYRVADITERNSLDTTLLKNGDQVYVIDAGNGEWALYIVSNLSNDEIPIVTWTKLGDHDSSTVDGRTIGTNITYQTSSPIDIYSVSPTTRIVLLTIEVTTPFHPSATLTVGDDEDASLLADEDSSDLSVVGVYAISPSYQFGGSDETNVKAFLNPGSSVSGEAKITMSYI